MTKPIVAACHAILTSRCNGIPITSRCNGIPI